MRNRMIAVVTLLAAFCGGCATQHGDTAINDFPRFHTMTPGEATPADVHQSFGQPHAVLPADDDATTWSYFYVVSRPNLTGLIPFVGLVTAGRDSEITQADFVFDANGALLSTSRSQRMRYTNTWAQLAGAFTPTGQVEAIRQEMDRRGLPFDEKAARDSAVLYDMHGDY